MKNEEYNSFKEFEDELYEKRQRLMKDTILFGSIVIVLVVAFILLNLL